MIDKIDYATQSTEIISIFNFIVRIAMIFRYYYPTNEKIHFARTQLQLALRMR